MSNHEDFRTVDGVGAVSLGGYDYKGLSSSKALDTGEDTPVQQHMRDEVDINTIVRRFGITRDMPAGIPGGVFGDFTGIEDFASAVAAVERARSGFMSLDPAVRERFNHDPGQLIELAHTLPEEDFMALVAPVAPPAPVPPAAPVV